MTEKTSEQGPAVAPAPAEPNEAAPSASAATVFERMIAIVAELPAIGKSQWNDQQKFHFRGHDDVLNALTPLLAKHGVVIVPRVLDRVTDKRTTRNGSVMYEVNLHIEYTFYGADGSSLIGSAWGEGTDMGDKATMKAGTMAFKAMLNQAFAISTQEGAAHDTDKGTVEDTVAHSQQQAAPPAPAAPAPPPIGKVVERLGVFLDEPTTWIKAAILGFYDDVTEFPDAFSKLPREVRNDAGPRIVQVALNLEQAVELGLFPGDDPDAAVKAAWAAAFDGKDITWPDYVAPIPF